LLTVRLPRDLPPEVAAELSVAVAVDVGATKTAALAFSLEAGVLGEATAGPANPDATPPDEAIANVLDAIGQAAGAARPDAILIASAGTDIHVLSDGLLPELSDVAYVEVVNDVIGAWASTAMGEDAMALISGTGSHGVAVLDGVAWRCGGWGHVFGDEGGAYQIGRAGVAAVLYSLDGRGPQTALGAMLCEELGVPRVEDLAGELYRRGATKSAVAALSRVVTAAAAGGDEVAQGIVSGAGADLADHVVALVDQQPEIAQRTCGLVGSAWHSAELLAAFREALSQAPNRAADVRCELIDRSPVRGLLALLLRMADRPDSMSALDAE
jgi:N-acetylglucosamine kinase-like BadF-type ATPase